jgi:thioesterase domain-containing protein
MMIQPRLHLTLTLLPSPPFLPALLSSRQDNDLDLGALARQNAADIAAVYPAGPVLVGGHSYGGAVAVEIAMVLESWGREVGLVLIMDTPLTAQIRPAAPTEAGVSDADCLELMEMILGALGRDALGMGASIAHPRESEEWKRMTVGWLWVGWLAAVLGAGLSVIQLFALC